MISCPLLREPRFKCPPSPVVKYQIIKKSILAADSNNSISLPLSSPLKRPWLPWISQETFLCHGRVKIFHIESKTFQGAQYSFLAFISEAWIGLWLWKSHKREQNCFPYVFMDMRTNSFLLEIPLVTKTVQVPTKLCSLSFFGIKSTKKKWLAAQMLP